MLPWLHIWGRGRLAASVFGIVLAGAVSGVARAYAPGSGTLFTESFNGTLDADWELGSGLGQPSPWSQILDGADKAFYADGYGPYFNSPTQHWARHFVQPVTATSFSIAFEYRAELGSTYCFDLEIEQRAPVVRKYRLRVNAAGALSLWRTVNGAFGQVVATGSGLLPANQKRWVRFAIAPDGSGHLAVRARVWSGGAAAEPASWTLEFVDENDTLERVHRFELVADGPKGTETWLDDLDAWGNAGDGVDSSVRTIYVVEASHLDIGFTEPPDSIEAFAKSHLDQVLTNLATDPSYRWVIEESWWLDRWWERSTESERQTLVTHLRSGRLSLGAGYASLHTTTAGHEELTRSIYWASRFAADHDVPLRTWITDDVPGSTFALPELLRRSGIEFYLGGMNATFGGRLQAPDHGDRPFWWVGPDGSRVLSWITFDSYAEGFDYGFSFFDTLADLYNKLGKKLPEQEESGYRYPELLLMRAFDNHYQGFHVRDLVEQWNATYATPRFRLATSEEFFDHMLATYGTDAFPSFTGDFGCAWSNSHAFAQHTEEMVRRAHREGLSAEALLAAGSAVDGGAVPQADIDFMYRRMLEVDEHSGAGGWPGYFTPEEMDRNNRIHLGYAESAANTARDLLGQGLARATAELSASGDAVAVVNPLGIERDGFARIVLPAGIYASSFKVVDRSTGTELAYQRFDATSEILFPASAVPAVGYRMYDLVPGIPSATPSGSLAVTPTSLENDFYRVTIDPADGSLTSLYDKLRGKEMVDTSSNYDFNELAASVKSEIDGGQPPVAKPPASTHTAVVTNGAWLAEVKVTRTGTPHAETTYRLYRGRDEIEFDNVLDRSQMPYVSQQIGTRAYTVTLPFNIHNLQIRTESATRHLDPASDGFERETVFDWHNVEHTLALFDASQGVFYAVDAVDAHSLENFATFPESTWSRAHALVLSRLNDRSDEYEFESGAVGPYEIEPGTSPILRYTHHARASGPGFDPVSGRRFGLEALIPLETRLVSRKPGELPSEAGSFFSVEPAGVALKTVKRADDGNGIILRLTELAGAAVTARLSSSVLTFADPLHVEQDEEGGTPLAMDGEAASVPLTPYETATVRLQVGHGWTPIQLSVDKDVSAGVVRLRWSGGNPPYTVERAEDATFSAGKATLALEEPITEMSDPSLLDGRTYFYLVR